MDLHCLDDIAELQKQRFIGLLTVFKPKLKPWFSATTEQNRNRNFLWAEIWF